jgi:VWFA-related protein
LEVDMRRFGVALCVLLGSAGRSPLAQQTPTFRSTVSLVVVDVSVLDRDGKPVPGLTADDFQVKLDGQVRPVRALTYEHVAPPAPARLAVATTAAPRREVTNRAPAGDPRLFVVMVDDLSLTASRGKRMFFSAARFVAGLPPSDPVGFTTSSGTASINPTLDHSAVAAALDKAVGDFVDPRLLPGAAVGLFDAVNVVNGDDFTLAELINEQCHTQLGLLAQGGGTGRSGTDQCATEVARKTRIVGGLGQATAERQLQAYLAVIQAMKPAPGLKQLVIISDGLALPLHRAAGIEDLQPIARAAAAAGVQISVLSEEPDITEGVDQRTDESNLRLGLQTMTDMTGGTYYQVIGTPDPFFQRVEAAGSAIYRIGVAAPDHSASGDFALSVRVNRRNVTVRANRHALAAPPVEVVPIETRLRETVATGTPLYGVPISLGTALRRDTRAGLLDLGINAEIPASVPGPLTVEFGLVDANGKVRSGRKVLDEPANGANYRVSLSLPVAPGAYRLRVAIADASDHIGSLDTAVTAQLNQIGPLLASDLLTAWTGADDKPQFLALEAVPSGATRLQTFLELYAATGTTLPANVRVRFALLSAGGDHTVSEHDMTPPRAGGVLHASTTFPFDTLSPGAYVVRASVMVANTVVGTVSATVRKLPPSAGPDTPWVSAAAGPLR